MILLCAITFLVAIADCVPVQETVARKIPPRITGTGYTEIRKVPYQAQLIRDDSILFCGATIIDHQWLLTASHCFIDQNFDVTVLTGSTFRLNGKESKIDKVFKHPEFNEVTLNNDICLIKLKEPLEFNEKQKSIPMLFEDVRDGEMIQISGYGRESDFSQHSPVIKVAKVPVMNKNECRNKYARVNDTITDSMFCAGDGQEDACMGDSGGPTVYNNHLVGVISAGRFCRSKEFPGVYTRLSVHYHWIQRTIMANSGMNTGHPSMLPAPSNPRLVDPMTIPPMAWPSHHSPAYNPSGIPPPMPNNVILYPYDPRFMRVPENSGHGFHPNHDIGHPMNFYRLH